MSENMKGNQGNEQENAEEARKRVRAWTGMEEMRKKMKRNRGINDKMQKRARNE